MYVTVKCRLPAGSIWKRSIAKNVNLPIHCVAKIYGSPDRSMEK